MIFLGTPGDPTYWIFLGTLFVSGIFAFWIHETGHLIIGRVLGDKPPSSSPDYKKFKVNSLKRISIIGFVFFFLLGLIWAKPVQMNVFTYRHPNRDAAITSFMGPVANGLFAGLILLICYVVFPYLQMQSDWLSYTLRCGLINLIFVNIVLAIISLFPFPGMDGEKVLRGMVYPFLSFSQRLRYSGASLYITVGFILLLVFLWAMEFIPSLYPVSIYENYFLPYVTLSF